MGFFTAAGSARRRGAQWSLVLAISAGLAASQASGPSPTDAATDPAPTRGALDGTQFAGTFGPDGGSSGRADTLYFSEGRFWSANCVPCGFVPALYWVRHDGDAIHFRGEMHSRERGHFTYAGVIRGGRVEASVRWQKSRWYWSIDRNFRFEGQRVEGTALEPVAIVTRRAVRAGTEPQPSAVCPL